MSSTQTCRRCIGLLDAIAENVEQATAFGPEARHMHAKLADLKVLLDEFMTGRYQDGVFEAALEAMASSLQIFRAASQRCCTQGPLETLFTANELHSQLVDSCLQIRCSLTQLLLSHQCSTVMRAQANLLSSQLSKTTVSFETLRRLYSMQSQLQEQAEQVRLDTTGSGAATAAFTAQIHRLAAACSQLQLASDVAFLEQRRAEAEADQRLVAAHFLQLSLSTVQSLAAAARDCEYPAALPSEAGRPGRGGWNSQDRAKSLATKSADVATSPRTSSSPHALMAVDSVEPTRFPVTSITSTLAHLSLGPSGTGTSPKADRAARIEAFCRALEGSERLQAVAALVKEGGVSGILRLLATSSSGQHSGPLRLLTALLAEDPGYGMELVAARGVQMLLHLLTSGMDGLLQLASEAARREANVAPEAGTVSLTVKSLPVRKGKAAVGFHHMEQRQQQQQMAAARVYGRQDRMTIWKEEDQEGAEVCLLVIRLLRQLSLSNTAELVSCGAVPVLCRAAGEPGGGRLASAAVAALSDLAHDSTAAVQMLHKRLLLPLSSLRLSDCPSKAAAALTCIAALLQHTADLPAHMSMPPPSQQHPPSDVLLLCGEMGRACDAACVSVLLDLMTDPTVTGGHAASPALEPGLSLLLPFCIHSSETRTSVLRHSAAMSLLLGRLANGDTAAAATLRRVAHDDGGKIVVARHLSQMLVSSAMIPNGATRSSPSRNNISKQATVLLCLADILRPASRDRSAARWAADAANECEQCGAVQPLVAAAASPDAVCRAAGLACLHALAVYGTQAVRTSLGMCGAVMCLVDAAKLEGVALPVDGSLVSLPTCELPSLGQAAAEALAALATSSDSLRRDVSMQLAAFLGSSSPQLAASACQALLMLLEACPAAGPLLLEHGVMNKLVDHLPKPPPGSGQGQAVAVHSYRCAVVVAARAKGVEIRGKEPDAAELLKQRAVRLVWALCRGGGAAVEVAVAAGAVTAILHRAAVAEGYLLRVEAAATLAPLLKKSAAAREVVADAGGLQALLELTCSESYGAGDESPPVQWEEALGGLAALAALQAPCRTEATRALRQMLVRGTTREAAAAAALVHRMCNAAAGREAVLGEDLVDLLVRQLSAGDHRAQAAAANAMSLLLVPSSVQLPPCAAVPAGGIVRPRLVLIRAGAPSALLTLLRDGGETTPISSSASTASSASSSSSAVSYGSATAGAAQQLSPSDLALVAAAEALESLGAGEEGVQAIRNAGGVQVLKAVVARGKRRLIPAAAARAASAALFQCM